MKIIDLLNKIANGEEVPKKIAIQNDVLIYNESKILNLQDWYYMNDEEDATWKIWAYKLNDEVEILDDEDEEKELPEKIKSNGRDFYSDYTDSWIDKEETSAYCEYLMNKYNDLIDYLEKQRKGE